MSGEQVDEEDREAGDGDHLQAEQPRQLETREGRAGKHARARTGGARQQVVEEDGSVGDRKEVVCRLNNFFLNIF